MRADVKLGVAVSAVLVSVVGGYFTFRGNGTSPAAPAGDANPAAVDPKSGKDTKPAAPAAQPNGKRVFPKPPAGADGKPQATTSPDPSQPNRRRTASPVNPTTGQPTPPGATSGVSTPAASPGARTTSPTSPSVSPIGGSTNPSPGAVRPPVTAPNGASPSTPSESKTPGGIVEKATEPVVRPAGDGSSGAASPAIPKMNADGANAPADASVPSGPMATSPKPSTDAATPVANHPAESAPAPSGSAVPSVPTRTPLSATSPVPNPIGSYPAAREPSSSVPGSMRTVRPNSNDRSAVATDTHRVQPGDTFASLAKNYYGSESYARFLKESNPQLAGSGILSPGSVVNIPATPKETASDPNATPSKGSKLASPVTPATGASPGAVKQSGKTYQVRTGDSFYSIARSALGDSKRWKELYEMNRKVVRDDPKSLRPGQVLTLPER